MQPRRVLPHEPTHSVWSSKMIRYSLKQSDPDEIKTGQGGKLGRGAMESGSSESSGAY